MHDDEGKIMPWSLNDLEQCITCSDSQRFLSREEFTKKYVSYDFLYGRGIPNSPAPEDGFRTLQKFLALSSGDVRGVLVFPIPSSTELYKLIQGAFKDRVGVGRNMYDANVQIAVPDASVSKLHAYIKRISGGLSLVDISSNGTRVNDRMIQSGPPGVILKPGDRIRFGKANLLFEYLLAPSCYDAARHDLRGKNETSDT